MFETLQSLKPKKQSFEMPQIMGILNVTPDSFSDGGNFSTLDLAVEQAKKLINDGADILDIGGESTRPGAAKVDLEEEINRVIPVIESIRTFSEIPISIDTSKPDVMRSAIAAGATMVNDVFALQKDSAIETVSDLKVPVCLMHMQGDPSSMQDNPQYDEIISEVKAFLRKRIFECQNSGIATQDIIVDPGFGFGKTLEQNYLMLKELAQFKTLGVRLLVGISRKSMIGSVTGTEVQDRLAGSLSAAVIAALNGADIIRVHDVLETKQALTVLSYTQN